MGVKILSRKSIVSGNRKRGVTSQEDIDRQTNREEELQIYNKIKEIKEEIEFTKHNGYDMEKNMKYINSLNVELNKLYEILELFERQYDLLDNDKTSVDDYLDKADILNKGKEYEY